MAYIQDIAGQSTHLMSMKWQDIRIDGGLWAEAWFPGLMEIVATHRSWIMAGKISGVAMGFGWHGVQALGVAKVRDDGQIYTSEHSRELTSTILCHR